MAPAKTTARGPTGRRGCPSHATERHGEETNGHSARHAGHRPTGVPGNGLGQNGQREHRSDRDAAQKTAGGDDHPSLARFGQLSPYQLVVIQSKACRKRAIEATVRLYFDVAYKSRRCYFACHERPTNWSRAYSSRRGTLCAEMICGISLKGNPSTLIPTSTFS